MADDQRPPRPPSDFPGETFDVPPPAHRLQLAPPLQAPKHLKDTKADPALPWEDMRRLYVNGVVNGPDIPDRTAVLERMGELEALTRTKGNSQGHRKNVMRVGKYKVVFPTITGVARFFNVSPAAVQQRAAAEDWHGLQRLYRVQLRQKHGQAKTRQRLERVEAIDNRAHATARLGLKMVQERLELLYSAVEVDDDGAVTQSRIMVDPREMDSLARAAQVWHALGRRALGFPVETVGAMKALDAAEMADFGLTPIHGTLDEEPEPVPLDQIGPGYRFDGGLIADGIDGLVDDKPSVSTELAKDDAERLHGFLSVLGRTQAASQGEDPVAEDELGDGAAQGEIGTGT